MYLCFNLGRVWYYFDQQSIRNLKKSIWSRADWKFKWICLFHGFLLMTHVVLPPVEKLISLGLFIIIIYNIYYYSFLYYDCFWWIKKFDQWSCLKKWCPNLKNNEITGFSSEKKRKGKRSLNAGLSSVTRLLSLDHSTGLKMCCLKQFLNNCKRFKLIFLGNEWPMRKMVLPEWYQHSWPSARPISPLNSFTNAYSLLVSKDIIVRTSMLYAFQK